MPVKQISIILLILAVIVGVLAAVFAVHPMARPTPPSSPVEALTLSTPAPVAENGWEAVDLPETTPVEADLEATPTPEPTPSNPFFTLASTGDLMVHKKNLTAAYDKSTRTFDYTRFFRQVKPYLEKTDLTIGNFESALGEGDHPDEFAGFPLFKTPIAFAEALKDAGFDILTLANNHILDQKFPGMVFTINTLESLGFHLNGASRTPEEVDKIDILEVNGIKVAFLSYTHYFIIRTNDLVPSELKDKSVSVYDRQLALSQIQHARELGAECVIVSMHWGPDENVTVPSQAYQDEVLALVQGGADAILGHHPHVLQKAVWLETMRTDGTTVRVPVLYSQGNFHCNPAEDMNAESCISYLTFERDPATGRIFCSDMAALPVYIYRLKTEPRDFVLVPIGLALDDQATYDDINFDCRSKLEEGWENILASLGDEIRIIRK